MFSESAEFYDAIYASFKDYRAEAARVAALLRTLQPQCRTVLDVGCGTGEHARLLAADGFIVDGLDLDPGLIRIAARKHPSGRFVVADMSAFQLSHRYDAILCLFSSLGYLLTLDRVRQALECFRRHLAPEGVVVVEPWFTPGVLEHGRVMQHTVESNGVRISRVSRMEIDGVASHLHFEYEIRDASGTRHVSETHDLGLFTRDELQRTFEEAGLRAEYDPEGLTGRGLYVARSAKT
jgi:ubiquinone/menaquinone biosynthesis C-methylase UbiE